MINKHFIKYDTYVDYRNDTVNVPDTSFVYIESPKMIVTRGLEFRCIGTMSVSQIQNFSPTPVSVKNNSGLYLISQGAAIPACGWVFMHSDTSDHTFEQIVFSNMTVSNGTLNGAHQDGSFNICYRSYGFSGAMIPQGKWTDWKILEVNKLIDKVFNKVGNFSCLLGGGNLYMQVRETVSDYDELFVTPPTITGSGGTYFDIYIAENYIKNVLTRMSANKENFKKIPVTVYTGKTDSRTAGYYISKSGSGVYSLTKQADGSFKTNIPTLECDVITDTDTTEANRIPMSGMFRFDINFFITSSKKYVTIMSYPTAIRSRQ